VGCGLGPYTQIANSFYPEILPLSVMVDARALALAPFVERGLKWFTVKFNFKSEGKVKY
jgi:hypothetical protein